MNKDEATKKVLDFIDAHTQIEKLANYIPSNIVSCEGQSKGLHLYREQKRDIARGILEQGLVLMSNKQIPIELVRIQELGLDPDKVYIVNMHFNESFPKELRGGVVKHWKKCLEGMNITNLLFNAAPDICSVEIQEEKEYERNS